MPYRNTATLTSAVDRCVTMTLVVKGRRATSSNSSRFIPLATVSPRFMSRVSPEWVNQMPPMKAKLII